MTTKIVKNIVENEIVRLPSYTSRYQEIICYKGSCTIQTGIHIYKERAIYLSKKDWDNAQFVLGDEKEVHLSAAGTKTAYTNMPRSGMKVTNVSADCELYIRGGIE